MQSKHTCLNWSKEDFNGDSKMMDRFFSECNELIIENINEIKTHWLNSRLVTIYYNDVFISEQPYEIYANCPYVNMPIWYAEEYAENKIENREWDAYCIPELVEHKVIFHE